MRLHIPAFALVASLVGGVASPVFGQSLADLARKEEERRKAAAATKDPRAPKPKVYTNNDVGNVPAAPPAVPAAPDAAAPASSPAASTPPADAAPNPAAETGATPADPAKDQAYWSSRIASMRTQLERDRTYIEALQSRLNALTRDFVNTDDPARRRALDNDRQRATEEMNRLQQSLVEQQKAIATFEEDARRQGVPPGWLR